MCILKSFAFGKSTNVHPYQVKGVACHPNMFKNLQI